MKALNGGGDGGNDGSGGGRGRGKGMRKKNKNQNRYVRGTYKGEINLSAKHKYTQKEYKSMSNDQLAAVQKIRNKAKEKKRKIAQLKSNCDDSDDDKPKKDHGNSYAAGRKKSKKSSKKKNEESSDSDSE